MDQARYHLLLGLTAALVCVASGCQEPASQARPVRPHALEIKSRPIDSKMFEAIRKNDLGELERLLAKGANPNATEANDWPAIVVAAQSLDMVKLLLSKGADINARQSDQGWTPLTQAITHNRSDIIQYLLDKGADPNLPLIDSSTPLHMAVRFGNIQAVEALLKHNVDVNARRREHPRALHDKDSEKRIGETFEPGYRDSGKTPIFEAVQRPGLIARLVAAGASVQTRDDNGWTPLHDAVKFGSIPGIKAFLKLGIDPNARSNQHYTPLHVAMRTGWSVPSTEIIRLLLGAGSDPKAINKQGQTPAQLLRADAARAFGSTKQSPSAIRRSASMRHALSIYEEALRVLEPGAAPLALPTVPVVEGWHVYPPIEFTAFGGELDGKIERKVRLGKDRTILSLLYKPGKNLPPAINIDELELSAYEPLDKLPLVLKDNQERQIAFPKDAALEGVATWLTYSYKLADGSGSGSLGEHGQPNLWFRQRGTQRVTEFYVHCDDVSRPVEFRIDEVKADGRHLAGYRGKVLLIPASDVDQFGMSTGTRLFIVPRGTKVNIRYSYRLRPNKKWRTGHMDLEG